MVSNINKFAATVLFFGRAIMGLVIGFGGGRGGGDDDDDDDDDDDNNKSGDNALDPAGGDATVADAAGGDASIAGVAGVADGGGAAASAAVPCLPIATLRPSR